MTDEEVQELIDNNTKEPPFNKPIPRDGEQVGHITAQDNGLQVGREENFVVGVVHPERLDDIEVGDYIRIPYYKPNGKDEDVNRQILASVQSLRYIQNHGITDRQVTSAETFGADNYVYLATLEPISTVELNEDADADEPPFISKFVSQPPRPTVKIDKVNESKFLRCGLEIPRSGMYIGDMAVNGNRIPSSDDPLPYYMRNPNHTDNTSHKGEPSIFRHALVAGSTGTGKTHLSKNILRQFAKCKEYQIEPSEEISNAGTLNRAMNLTIIDPEGEYTEMAHDPEDMARVEKVANKRPELEYGGIKNDEDTEFRVFAPVTRDLKSQQKPSVNVDYREFGIPFSLVRHHHGLLMPDDPQGPTANAIHEVLTRFFNQSNSRATYEEFRDWFTDPAMKENLENEFGDTVIRAVSTRVTKSLYSRVFDNGSRMLTDDSFIQDMFKSEQVSVITTNHLRGSEENLIIQSILSYIVENKISADVDSPEIKSTPMVLALDEAHEYINYPETTREEQIVTKFRKAARRGRKDLFGLYLISQDPQDIDGEVRNQLNTKIYLQLDSRIVNSGDVFIPYEYQKQVSDFEKGQMVVVQPNVRNVEVRGLPVCLTRHDS